MPPIDYNPLRNRIRDLGLTQKECAEKIGISEGQLCQKMAGIRVSPKRNQQVVRPFGH